MKKFSLLFFACMVLMFGQGLGPPMGSVGPFIAPTTQWMSSVDTTHSVCCFTSFLGFRMTVLSPITLTKLGRVCAPGNSQSHTVYLASAITSGTGTPITNVTINLAGCTTGVFTFGSITPQALATGDYFITSSEASPDNYLDCNSLTTYTYTGVAILDACVIGSGGTPPTAFASFAMGNIAYGVPNFFYHP